ncbi:MAG: Mpo1-like protein [Alteraurantiacibacter sp.]
MSIAVQLSKYREYHHDHRNVLTHAVGIPMIALGITTLLARPVLEIGSLAVTPAILAGALAAVWYLRLDLRTGLLMTALLALFVALGHLIAQLSSLAWLGGGIGLFAIGWLFQLIGHKFEGRKPAFVDDLRSFLVGPLFVVVEGLFAMGMMQDLRREVER